MTNEEKLISIVENFNNLTVLCVGDLILDKFIMGNVNRISPEAPVPVFNILDTSYTLGGAGNVAANFSSLGAKCILLGVIGKDHEGSILKDLTNKIYGIDSKILIDKNRPTTSKLRYISSGQHMLRVDNEVSTNISVETEKQIYDKIIKVLDNVDVVILSDYGKGVITKTLSVKIIKSAKKN
ncbi:PfkB family carbohydrate kinase [Alphaproteobacteria bacterium]|nr:PfkB family carbohydrate kinase [Alphaproteobacteria bacterium]